MKHSVLTNQLEQAGINFDSLDQKTQKLLISIDETYLKQDQARFRLNGVVDSLRKENDVLQKSLDKKTEAKAAAAQMTVLTEMAAGIAHEVNNPLMILQATIALIDETLDETKTNTDFIKEQLCAADKTVDRIARIVIGLRTFSRDAKQDAFKTVDLKTVVSDTISLCGEKLKKSRIKIINQVTNSTLIDCRSCQLSQVFLSLILNSKDAVMTQKDRWIRIESEEKCNSVILRFTDSGCGIPVEIQDKVMNPFFTTKPVGKGTGMGLSVSKGIIESHNGDIRIRSDVANTCFEIELPKKQLTEVKAA